MRELIKLQVIKQVTKIRLRPITNHTAKPIKPPEKNHAGSGLTS
ncbi:MAG: hypothetical protein ACOC56_02310 [Atribacterota bacterium]